MFHRRVSQHKSQYAIHVVNHTGCYSTTKIFYVMLQSKMIGDAAYESLWYELNRNQHQDVLLMITRSQKYLTLTVGKFVDLSLQQFANVRREFNHIIKSVIKIQIFFYACDYAHTFLS